MEEKFQNLIEPLKNKFLINDITELKYLNKIYKLFINDNREILREEELSKVDLLYIALYFFIKEDYNNTIKYFKLSIEKNNIYAMFNLGNLYYYSLNDFENAEQYYLMGVKNKHIDSMNKLGLIFLELEQYEKAKIYFNMTAEYGDPDSLSNLGSVYYRLGEYKNAERCYLTSIENNNNDNNNTTYVNLGMLYLKLKDDDNAYKYLGIAASNGCTNAQHLLILHSISSHLN